MFRDLCDPLEMGARWGGEGRMQEVVCYKAGGDIGGMDLKEGERGKSLQLAYLSGQSATLPTLCFFFDTSLDVHPP